MSTAEGTEVSRAHAAHSFYPINIRVTVPFAPRPFFITLIAGTERRGAERLRQERARHPINTWGNLATFVVASTICATAMFFGSLILAAL